MRSGRRVPLRLGVIDYLNCLPLNRPLLDALAAGGAGREVELVPGTPAEVNRLFRAGEVDVSPISSIEFARLGPAAMALPDLSIAADGPVRSILLFARQPIGELCRRAREGAGPLRVALTSSSATAATLTRVLMRLHFAVPATYETMAPELGRMLERADAALLIGDDALRAARAGEGAGLFAADLGLEWKRFTGLPMVFAVWAVRRQVARRRPAELSALWRRLVRAREEGRRRLSALVCEGAARLGLQEEVVRRYLGETIRHVFPPPYQRALAAFFAAAHACGELPAPAQVAMWRPAAAGARAAL